MSTGIITVDPRNPSGSSPARLGPDAGVGCRGGAVDDPFHRREPHALRWHRLGTRDKAATEPNSGLLSAISALWRISRGVTGASPYPRAW
jgi:hypothetical protein